MKGLALETLATIAPTISEPDSVKALDKELTTLTYALLGSRESGHAALAAALISNEKTRNGILLDILQRQCKAAPGQAEQMIGKAEATLALLTGEHREKGNVEIFYAYTYADMIAKAEKAFALLPEDRLDNGYSSLVYAYLRTREFDKAEETAAKITDARLRDHAHMTISHLYASNGNIERAKAFLSKMQDPDMSDKQIVKKVGVSYYATANPPKTYLNEKERLRLIELIQSPLHQAEAKMSMANFYGRFASQDPAKADVIGEVESRQKRSEALHEATELLRPLPGSLEKTLVMIDIIQNYDRFKEKDEAKTVENMLFDSLLAIENGELLYKCLGKVDISRMSRWHPDQETIDAFLAKLKRHAESLPPDTQTTGRRREAWLVYTQIANYLKSPTGESLTETIAEARQVAREANYVHQGEYARTLLGFIDKTPADDKEQIGRILDEVIEIYTLKGGWHWEAKVNDDFIKKCMKHEFTDKLLAFLHSPALSEGSKQQWYMTGAYYKVARALLEAGKSETSEFRAEDFQKIYDLITSADNKKSLLSCAEDLKGKFYWAKPVSIEDALAIPQPWVRYRMCRLLIIVNCENKTDVDISPLLAALEELPKAENDFERAYQYHETLRLALRYSLWDAEKITDWLAKYESAISKLPESGTGAIGGGMYPASTVRNWFENVKKEVNGI